MQGLDLHRAVYCRLSSFRRMSSAAVGDLGHLNVCKHSTHFNNDGKQLIGSRMTNSHDHSDDRNLLKENWHWLGWGGGGANSEYLSVILRGIQRKKADGLEAEGVMEPITFLTKRPKGVPMFCVIDSNVIKNKMY